MVNFINTAPIYESWKSRSIDPTWQLIEATPSRLNKMLAAGELDLGFVSSYEYCARPHLYRIFDDLSISANGSVGSVFLFSKVPFDQLSDCDILLSGQSDTSVGLIKIIVEQFIKVHPRYLRGEVESELASQCQAVLAIGDEALRLNSSGEYAYSLDLAEAWNRHTGLPFVFAVCAVREDFLAREPGIASAVHHTFHNCREEGRKNLESICRLAAPRIPMHPDECYTYLRAIEYDLGYRKKLALEKFFQYLIVRNEVSSEALPIKYVFLTDNDS